MIKKWVKFNEGTIVDAKIELLKDLSLDLSDMGLKIDVWNGSWKDTTWNKALVGSKYIIMSVTDPDCVLDDNYYYENNLFNKKEIFDFEEHLKSYGMTFRSKIGNGQNGVLFYFDKHGKMTNSELVR